ncbi:MAG: PqqD family protein [Candidatus Sulfotelmatobacter sp.]
MSTVLLRKPDGNDHASAAQLRQIFVRSQSVVSRLIGGETLIVPVRGNVGDLASIYSFNQIGSLIWRLLDIPKSLGELVAEVEQEYEVDSERARKDVEQFLNDMLSAGLVEVRSAAAVVETEPVGRVHLAVAGPR